MGAPSRGDGASRALTGPPVAELGDGAACCELVPCVVRRHGRRLPIARFLAIRRGRCPGRYERLGRGRPGASVLTRDRQRPAAAARLATIERIDRTPRRPVTVAPSLAPGGTTPPPVVIPAALSHTAKRCMVGAPR